MGGEVNEVHMAGPELRDGGVDEVHMADREDGDGVNANEQFQNCQATMSKSLQVQVKLRLPTRLCLQRKRIPPPVCFTVSIRPSAKEVQIIILLSFYAIYLIILN